MRNLQDLQKHFFTLIESHEWERLRKDISEALVTIRLENISVPPHMALFFIEWAEQACLPHAETTWFATIAGGGPAQRAMFRSRHADRFCNGTFVPIGCECHPWVLLNRWGFRDSLRELNPLALGIHRMPALLDLLATDFASYCQPENLSTRLHPPTGEQMVVDPLHGVTWNHHRGDAWTGSGFERLCASNRCQLENLRASSRRPGAVHLISQWRHFNPDTHGNEIHRLLDAIAGLGATEPRLIIMNFDPSDRGEGIHHLGENVYLIDRIYPENYSWAGVRYYNRPDGVAWEAALIADVLKACDALGSLPADVGRSDANRERACP